MEDIIDIDTGPIIEGEKTIEQMGEEILEYCIQAASGEVMPKAVLLNQDDFIPWKRGVVSVRQFVFLGYQLRFFMASRLRRNPFICRAVGSKKPNSLTSRTRE